ncbi:unnamed protein product [Pedinophyceae sp. YPF-701]|nr:unnamed protein product [Pedinophyceae sp. YPF-701]
MSHHDERSAASSRPWPEMALRIANLARPESRTPRLRRRCSGATAGAMSAATASCVVFAQSVAAYGVEVVEDSSSERGRRLVAQRGFEAGDLVLANAPFSLAPFFGAERCHYCLDKTVQSGDAVRCSGATHDPERGPAHAAPALCRGARPAAPSRHDVTPQRARPATCRLRHRPVLLQGLRRRGRRRPPRGTRVPRLSR